MRKVMKLDQVQIRKMTINDYDAAYSLWKKLSEMNLREEDDNLVEISRLLKFNPELCYVAFFNQKLIGTIMGATDGRRGKIYHLAIDKDYRGLKLAQRFLNLVSTELQKIGIRKISICVMKDNELGEKFWNHVGYQRRTDIDYLDRIL